MEIRLRPWTLEDKEALMALCNGVDRTWISGRIPSPYTEKDAEWWLHMTEEQDGKSGIFRAITADGRIVGNISLERKADVHAWDAELGYLLDKAFWSRGIMTKATGLICAEGFEKLKLLRITGLVYKPNTASRRVLEKSGFIQEGLMRNAIVKDGNVYDLCVYGKLRPEK